MEKLLKKLKKSLKNFNRNEINQYLQQGFEISGSTFFVILKSNIYDMFGENYKKVKEFLEFLENNDYVCSHFFNDCLNFRKNIEDIYSEFLPIYQNLRENKNQMIDYLLNKDKEYITDVLYYFEQLIFQEYKRNLNEKWLEIYSQFLCDTNLLVASIELSQTQEIRSKNKEILDFVKELITEYSTIIEFKNKFFDLLSGRYNLSVNNHCYAIEPAQNNIDLVTALYEANRLERRMISLDKKGKIYSSSSFRKTSLEFMYKDFGYKIDDEIEVGVTFQDVYNVWNNICEFVDGQNNLKPMWLKIDYDKVIKKELKKILSKEQFHKIIESYFMSEKTDLYLYPIQKYGSQYRILNWGTDIEFTYLLNNIVRNVSKTVDKKFYEFEIINDLKIVKEILFKNNNNFLVFPTNVEFKNLAIEIDLMFLYNDTLFIADVKHTMKKFESISNLRKLNYTYDGIVQVDYICKFIKENKELFIDKLKKEKGIDIPDFKEVKGFLVTNEGKFSGVKFNRDIPIITREDLWRFFAYPVVLVQLPSSGVDFITKHWWDFSKVPNLKSFLNYLDDPFKDNFPFKEYIFIEENNFSKGNEIFTFRYYKYYKEPYSNKYSRGIYYSSLIEAKKFNKMRNKATRFLKNNFYVIDFTEKSFANSTKDVKDVKYWIELQGKFSAFDDTSNRR
ncbi:hypothetical protein [Metabacillus fastidiosus]|uniref:NERD domain-containing protein n=1 Tax=Metabacillus fastidiosus TaxID=1458 RepID=A0ABU6NT70_9BACI|nr:hypothetical protein [Metabacillus fastidiosus]MED4400339.1 hypothetical protein [Metabacillus fastidiosus]